MTPTEILENIGRAQGQAMRAQINGNIELEEHYLAVATDLIAELSQTKTEI